MAGTVRISHSYKLQCGKSRCPTGLRASCKNKNPRCDGGRKWNGDAWLERKPFAVFPFTSAGEELLPPSLLPGPLRTHHSHSDLSLPLSPSFPFLPLNPAHLAVLAFRRSPSRIPPPLRRRCCCPPASAVLEAAAGAEGVEPPASGGWVCRMVIASWSIRTRIRRKGGAFVGSRHAGGFGASAVRRASGLVLALD